MKSMDEDYDGKVDFEEFSVAMKRFITCHGSLITDKMSPEITTVTPTGESKTALSVVCQHLYTLCYHL